MPTVTITVAEYEQEQALPPIPGYRCPACGAQAGAAVMMRWRVRTASGIPVFSKNARADYQCYACGTVVTGGLPPGAQPPVMHRMGCPIMLAFLMIIPGILVPTCAIPAIIEGRKHEKQRQELDPLRDRVHKAKMESMSSIRCWAKLNDATKKAFPDGILKAKPARPAAPLTMRELQVFYGKGKDGLVPGSWSRVVACDEKTWNIPEPSIPYTINLPGDAAAGIIAEAKQKVVEYEEALAKLAPPQSFVWIDSECTGPSCAAAAAVITLDGRSLGVAVVKTGPRPPAGGAGYEVWQRDQLEKQFADWNKPGDAGAR